jgi:hypothetical protein
MVSKGKRRKRRCACEAAGVIVSRDKCRACLDAVWLDIKAGKLTEREAEDRGRLGPRGTPGRPLKRKAVKR